MNKPKVLIISEKVPKIAFDLLSEHFEVICVKDNYTEIISKIAGVHALLWASVEKIDKNILDKTGPQLRVISTMTVGYEHIDIKEVKARGIYLGNTAEVSKKSVADTAVLLTLAAVRRFQEGRIQIESGRWNTYNWLLGQDIEDSTVGIVGCGAIGQEIIKKLKVFDVAKFIYCGYKEKPEAQKLGAIFVSFDELLQKSDIIIAACPYNTETHKIFNTATFKKMKSTAVFVNIARGKIVDHNALIEALESKTIFAAGLDVMNPEPLPPGHKLISLPNCVLLPHLGSATVKIRNKMAEIAAKNIIAVFKNKPMPSPI